VSDPKDLKVVAKYFIASDPGDLMLIWWENC